MAKKGSKKGVFRSKTAGQVQGSWDTVFITTSDPRFRILDRDLIISRRKDILHVEKLARRGTKKRFTSETGPGPGPSGPGGARTASNRRETVS